jgi:hypothetical protein
MTTNTVETALYSKLTGASGLTSLLSSNAAVYNQLAAPGAVLPYVVFSTQAETDDNESPHRAKQLLVLVKGISAIGFAEAGTIDAAIDTALHRVTLSVSGWTNFQTRRESSVRYLESLPGSGTAYHAGGIYRLRIAQ